MSGIGNFNLKVLVFDPDFYALQAMNGYLAWDRRTRVTFLAETPDQMWDYIDITPDAELPDVILLDCDDLGGPQPLAHMIRTLQESITDVMILCLAQFADPDLVETAARLQTNGYLLKHEVRLKIAWAIIYAIKRDFVVTDSVPAACETVFDGRLFRASVLPEQREYPELTDRIRQAIKLAVIEGLPAYLAADEMGISLHTIRGYIKEGYRILEAYDQTNYPVDMTPQERAFLRFTALADDPDEV